MGRHEEDVLGKILPCLQNNINQERDMWHKSSGHIPSQTILGLQANVSVLTLRSGKELPRQQAISKNAKGKVAQSVIIDPHKNELCTNKRKKLKGDVEVRRNVSGLIKSKQVFSLIQLAMPKNIQILETWCFGTNWYSDPIDKYEHFTSACILEDVLVQVSDMIFPTDFYVLNLKDELSSKWPTLILGRPFIKTPKSKIDVHAGTLSMEFGNDRVEYIPSLRP
ncbi:hypothetical protein CR513_33263, partial [Mucuna pruriens]